MTIGVQGYGYGGVSKQLLHQLDMHYFATNHLGHFVLTGLLLESLERGEEPRVVTVASGFYRLPKKGLDFGDRQGEQRYSPFWAYVRSKVANVLFGIELERRPRATGSSVRSLLAHPGVASTPMQRSANSPVEGFSEVRAAPVPH